MHDLGCFPSGATAASLPSQPHRVAPAAEARNSRLGTRSAELGVWNEEDIERLRSLTRRITASIRRAPHWAQWFSENSLVIMRAQARSRYAASAEPERVR